jgi:PadR family transcriptional regulator, regulatory protein PadR
MCDERERRCGCRCSCEVRGFIQPRLLLLLARKASHGYELMEALRAIPGSENLSDPGMMYRTLRQLEQAEVLRSAWDTDGRGPARRVYELTNIGREQLEIWAAEIRKTRTHLDEFLAEYESIAEHRSAKKRKRG